MSGAEIIQIKIKKKEGEIAALEKKIEAAKVYLTALHDIRKEMGNSALENEEVDGSIRKGSTVDQARDAILAAGKPLHLDEILQAIGKEVSRETKASLNGSLAAYVRKRETFTRPAPSTYGLMELDHFEIEQADEQPPAGFGHVAADIDDEIPF